MSITRARIRADLCGAAGTVISRGRDLILRVIPDAEPGTVLHAARRARVEAEDAVAMAVIFERSNGASWDQVAEWLHESPTFVIAHYQPLVDQYNQDGSIRPVVLVKGSTGPG